MILLEVDTMINKHTMRLTSFIVTSASYITLLLMVACNNSKVTESNKDGLSYDTHRQAALPPSDVKGYRQSSRLKEATNTAYGITTEEMESNVMTEERKKNPENRKGIVDKKEDLEQDFNTEDYAHIVENPFQSPKAQPLSTFSIDVDAASYANVRRFIESNSLPYPDAVRIEEMVNYFNYDYPAPTGKDPFSITTELGPCPWNPEHHLIHIGLQGEKIELENAPNSNLVFLLDVSGSMNSPDKLPLLKKAFRLLVKELKEEDKVAIVVYAGAAGVVLPSTSAANQSQIIEALELLEAGGSTAGGEGIELAYEIAKKNFIEDGNNRVILATDGDFNVGPSSDGELVRLIEKKREEGVFLSVLGFGTGNLQDSKMESLADKGNGNYAYIDNILEAKKVLVNEMGGTLFTIAKDVKIQIEFNPAQVKAYRLIGYENRMLAAQDFNDDKKDAGELGAGHTVTALYEIIPPSASTEIPSVDSLKYQKSYPKNASLVGEWMTVKFRYKKPDGDTSKLLSQTVNTKPIQLTQTSDNFRFSAAVASFGMLLRKSDFKGDASYKSTIGLAKTAIGPDPYGYKNEFIKLVEKAELLDTPSISLEKN